VSGSCGMVDDRHALVASFERYVLDESFPCVGAKAAVNRGGAVVCAYDRLATLAATAGLATDLRAFLAAPHPGSMTTFVALFAAPARPSEGRFEHLLWRQLQLLHDVDDVPWDDSVSSRPDRPDFAFSFAGRACFVVGLHPRASRLARRFERPALVFNRHDQFEELKRDGRYARIQAATRHRDAWLQGTINPMLADFGSRSEARQYSGRAVGPGWQCPFRAREGQT
jgi:uncharacterized protein